MRVLVLGDGHPDQSEVGSKAFAHFERLQELESVTPVFAGAVNESQASGRSFRLNGGEPNEILVALPGVDPMTLGSADPAVAHARLETLLALTKADLVHMIGYRSFGLQIFGNLRARRMPAFVSWEGLEPLHWAPNLPVSNSPERFLRRRLLRDDLCNCEGVIVPEWEHAEELTAALNLPDGLVFPIAPLVADRLVSLARSVKPQGLRPEQGQLAVLVIDYSGQWQDLPLVGSALARLAPNLRPVSMALIGPDGRVTPQLVSDAGIQDVSGPIPLSIEETIAMIGAYAAMILLPQESEMAALLKQAAVLAEVPCLRVGVDRFGAPSELWRRSSPHLIARDIASVLEAKAGADVSDPVAAQADAAEDMLELYQSAIKRPLSRRRIL